MISTTGGYNDLLQTLLKEAKNTLSEDDVEAFCEAVQKAPHIVELDSHPSKYLRAAEENITDAASRLALFWKVRKTVFGDRYLLPMSVTGEGTLTEKDIKILKTGFQAILPGPSKDDALIFFNHTNPISHRGEVKMERFRSMFYLLWIVAKEGKSLKYIRYSEKPTTTKTRVAMFRDMCNSLPFPYPIIFLDVSLPPPGAKRMFEQMANALLQHTVGKGFWGKSFKVVYETKKEILNELVQKHKIPKECLPTIIGGTWEYSNVETWLLRRQHVERALLQSLEQKPSPVASAPTACHSHSPLRAGHRLPLAKRSIRPQFGKESPTDDSKPPCKPPPTKLEQLSQAAMQMKDLPAPQEAQGPHDKEVTKGHNDSSFPKHKMFRSESSSISDDLGKDAKKQRHFDDYKILLQRKKRKREMDIEYSRKRRAREKRQEDDLRATCAELSEKSAALRAEEKRLTGFLNEAKWKISVIEGVKKSRSQPKAVVPTAASAQLSQPSSGPSVHGLDLMSLVRQQSSTTTILDPRVQELQNAARNTVSLPATSNPAVASLLPELGHLLGSQATQRPLVETAAQRLQQNTATATTTGISNSAAALLQSLLDAQHQQSVPAASPQMQQFSRSVPLDSSMAGVTPALSLLGAQNFQGVAAGTPSQTQIQQLQQLLAANGQSNPSVSSRSLAAHFQPGPSTYPPASFLNGLNLVGGSQNPQQVTVPRQDSNAADVQALLAAISSNNTQATSHNIVPQAGQVANPPAPELASALGGLIQGSFNQAAHPSS